MLGHTGTWEEGVINFTTRNSQIVDGVVMLIILCGAVLGIRYLWRKYLRQELIDLWNVVSTSVTNLWYTYVKNPISWLIQPIRRVHSKWSAGKLRDTMAKWRKGHLANAFYETIHREIEAGRLSKQQGKQLQAQMAKFFGLDDLARIKTHEKAVEHKLMLNRMHEVGPAQEHPAWGDPPSPIKAGDPVGPPVESLGSKWFNRKQVA